VRQIGLDWTKKGLQDDEIVVALRRLNKATLFTRDLGFYRPEVRHSAYCVVVMKVDQTKWLSLFDASFAIPLSMQGQNEWEE
jgi:hypothetical protein